MAGKINDQKLKDFIYDEINRNEALASQYKASGDTDGYIHTLGVLAGLRYAVWNAVPNATEYAWGNVRQQN